MNVTNNQQMQGAAGLLPARLADEQLDYFERVVQVVTQPDADFASSQFDRKYWEKRIQTLVQTHDLVATQRRRVIVLLDLLEQHALIKPRTRTAA